MNLTGKGEKGADKRMRKKKGHKVAYDFITLTGFSPVSEYSST